MGTKSKSLSRKNRNGEVIRPSGIPRTEKLTQREVTSLLIQMQTGNRHQRRAAVVKLKRYNMLVSKVRTIIEKDMPEDLTSQVLGDTLTVGDIEDGP